MAIKSDYLSHKITQVKAFIIVW